MRCSPGAQPRDRRARSCSKRQGSAWIPLRAGGLRASRDTLETAAVIRPTFYNKRDILDHVVTQAIERLLGALTQENAPDAARTLESYREQTERIAHEITKIFQDDPRAARMLLLEATSIDTELTDRLLSVFDTAATLIAGYFENGVRHGYIRADLDTVASAEAVVGMMIAGILNILRHPDDPARYERFSAALLRLMLDGILAPPASDPGQTPDTRSAPA